MDGYQELAMTLEVIDHSDYLKKIPGITTNEIVYGVMTFARTFWGEKAARLCRRNIHLFIKD